MDLEQLTKTQIILLTLLVSFVTSIATGIATVALMEDAPKDVTRIISQIIEKPIETIVPGGTKTVVEQKTVVVSEGERIADAVAKANTSVVRLYVLSGRTTEFKGFGVIISEDGGIIADTRIVDKRKSYIAVLADGTQVSLRMSDPDTEAGVLHFGVTKEKPDFTVATLAPFHTLKLGQTVVALSGETTTKIAPGVIAQLLPEQEGNGNASRLQTTIDATGIVLGSPLIDLDGNLIGMPEEAGSQIFLTLSHSTAPQN